MKKIYLIFALFTAALYTSCVLEDAEVVNSAGEGVLPVITAGSTTTFNLLNPAETVDFSVNAATNNGNTASSADIEVSVKGSTWAKIGEASSFPATYTGSLADALTAAGKTTADVTGGDDVRYRFVMNVGGQKVTSATYFTALILCPPIPGVYNVSMADSYGDGWQGGNVVATVDGVEIGRFNVCDKWSGTCPAGTSFTSATASFTVPAGAKTLILSFTADSYGSEVSFQVYDPNGTKISDESDPAAGALTLPSTCP